MARALRRLPIIGAIRNIQYGLIAPPGEASAYYSLEWMDALETVRTLPKQANLGAAAVGI